LCREICRLGTVTAGKVRAVESNWGTEADLSGQTTAVEILKREEMECRRAKKEKNLLRNCQRYHCGANCTENKRRQKVLGRRASRPAMWWKIMHEHHEKKGGISI